MFSCYVHDSTAQAIRPFSDLVATGTSYHVFARPGESTIQVQVLGAALPGIYEVREGTDLSQLLALAGGNPLGPRNTREERSTTVELFRPDARGRPLIYASDYEAMLRDTQAYPKLADGDVFVIETIIRERPDWRTYLQIGTLALQVTAIVINLARN